MAAVWDGKGASLKPTLCSPMIRDSMMYAPDDFLCERDSEARRNREIGGVSLMSVVPRPSLDQSATDILLVDSLQAMPLSRSKGFEARICRVIDVEAKGEWSSALAKRCTHTVRGSMQASQGNVLQLVFSGTARDFDSLYESFGSSEMYVPV